jgi:hypothetical protein
MDLWCPFADFVPVRGHDRTGPMTGGAAKILHHTTEGDTIAGAEATYEHTGDLPHFTDTFERGFYEVHQHLPLDQYATALMHPKGTGETNTDNVIQIEHVGHTATSSTWADGYLDGIAILCRWIELQTGCARVAIASFAPGARRLSWPEWHRASGHCGHMHCPGNDHVDPGAMDIGHILTAGQPQPAPPSPPSVIDLSGDDDMPLQQITLDVGPLDDQGNGCVLFDGGQTAEKGITRAQPIPWPSVRCVEVQGSFPPVDGYRPLPRVGRQDRDGFLCVELQGGAAKGPITLLVTVAA